MKSDREFLDGIWEIVAQTEYEETQKELATARHKKIMKKNILTYISAVVIFLAIYISVLFNEAFSSYGVVFIISVISLMLAYTAEGLLSGENDTESLMVKSQQAE